MGSADRRGTVLVVAVLALVALGLLAHGALLLARQELAASQAGARLLQARAAAEAGYRAALASTGSARLEEVPLGGEAPVAGGSVGGHAFRSRALRLGRESWWIEGEGRAASEPWGVGVGGPVWILDPVGRLEDRTGVVELAGNRAWAPGIPVDAFTIPEAVPLPGDECGRWGSVLDSLSALQDLPEVVRVGAHPEGEPSLGLLGPSELKEALEPLGWPRGSPGPSASDGACDRDDPLNLGDPDHPDAACRDHVPARFHDGDLMLEGGVGQGILVVRGDVTLVGTRFHGVVLAGGSLTLRDGAWLLGAARVGGGLAVQAGSHLTGSGCRVLRALDATSAPLRRPIPLVPPIPLGPARHGAWSAPDSG